MNVSDVMVQYLQAAGVRHIFGYPGDPNIEFMEAARRSGMQFVRGRREGTAGLMAEACGLLTGGPEVCMSTLGPGSSNLVNAVANAGAGDRARSRGRGCPATAARRAAEGPAAGDRCAHRSVAVHGAILSLGLRTRER